MGRVPLAPVICQRAGDSTQRASTGDDAGDQVSGQIISYIERGWSASLYGEQAAYNAVSNPAPQVGHYTMALPGTADGLSGPQGYGFAVLTVDNAGNVRLRGALPDSSVITASAILSNDGACPCS